MEQLNIIGIHYKTEYPSKSQVFLLRTFEPFPHHRGFMVARSCEMRRAARFLSVSCVFAARLEINPSLPGFFRPELSVSFRRRRRRSYGFAFKLRHGSATYSATQATC